MAFEEYRPIVDTFVEGVLCFRCPHYRDDGEWQSCAVLNRKVEIRECPGRGNES